MAYFLKKSNVKKETYLQIYESFYDPNRGHTAHRSYKALGYVHELMEQGIDDPLTFYKNEVAALNEARKGEKHQHAQISEETPEKFLGYFPLKAVHDELGVKQYLDLIQSVTGYRFNLPRKFHPPPKRRGTSLGG